MRVVDSFIDGLKASGATEQTLTRYRQAVEAFIKDVGEKKAYTKEDVLRYLGTLRDKGYSGGYLLFVWHVLKALYILNGWGWFTPAEEKRLRPKRSEPQRPFLTVEEMKALIDLAREKAEKEGKWDTYARVLIATQVPIRREEFRKLNLEHYNQENGVLMIPTAKHGEVAPITLNPEAKRALDNYLEKRLKMKIRNRDAKKALFISKKKRRISLSELSTELQALLREAGIYRKGLGWHGLRRGITTALHKAGLSERELQTLGRWRTPTMPHTYIQLSHNEVEEKAKRIHPIFKAENDGRMETDSSNGSQALPKQEEKKEEG